MTGSDVPLPLRTGRFQCKAPNISNTPKSLPRKCPLLTEPHRAYCPDFHLKLPVRHG